LSDPFSETTVALLPRRSEAYLTAAAAGRRGGPAILQELDTSSRLQGLPYPP